MGMFAGHKQSSTRRLVRPWGCWAVQTGVITYGISRYGKAYEWAWNSQNGSLMLVPAASSGPNSKPSFLLLETHLIDLA